MRKGSFIKSYIEQVKNQVLSVRGTPMNEEELLRLNQKIKDNYSKFESEYDFEFGDQQDKLDENGVPSVELTNPLTVANMLEGGDPLISTFGTLFKQIETKESLPSKMLRFILSERKIEKAKMFQFEDGTNEFDYHDRIQKILKVLANSYYGALGQSSFIFFNKLLGPSVTYNGRSIITTSMMSIEALMENNVEFDNINEMLTFIANISLETIQGKTQYNLTDYVNPENMKSKDDIFEYLDSLATFDLSKHEKDVLSKSLSRLSSDVLTRIYYKRNFLKFLENEAMLDILGTCFHTGFMDVEEPPEEIADNLKNLFDVSMEFVRYDYLYYNRAEKAESMKRKSVLIVDTDSVFIYLNPFFEFMEEHFDIGSDNTFQRLIYVCNIATYLASNFIQSVLDNLTSGCNAPLSDKPRINMKSELLYRRILLTRNKKQYAGEIILQEGKPFPEGKPKFDMKGIPLRKVSTNKVTRKVFTDILVTDIIKEDANKVSRATIMGKYFDYAQSIRSSLDKCEVAHLKPEKFSAFDNYENPYQMQVVRGVLVWNALYPSKEIRNQSKVLNIKLNKTASFEELEAKLEGTDISQDLLDTINDVVYRNESMAHYQFDVLSIPLTEREMPKWVVPLLNHYNIIHDNLSPATGIMDAMGMELVSFRNKEAPTSIIQI